MLEGFYTARFASNLGEAGAGVVVIDTINCYVDL